MTVRDTLQHRRSTLSQPFFPDRSRGPAYSAPRLARFPGPKHAQTHRGPSLQPPRARRASSSVILPRPGEARETSRRRERVSNVHMPRSPRGLTVPKVLVLELRALDARTQLVVIAKSKDVSDFMWHTDATCRHTCCTNLPLRVPSLAACTLASTPVLVETRCEKTMLPGSPK